MPFDLRAIVAVFIGGGLGSVARYGVNVWSAARYGPSLPLGTFIVNVAGSLVIGVVAELAAARLFGITPLVRTFIITGVLGGFTTFSSFSLDMLSLATNRSPMSAFAYAALSVVCGFAAAYGGMLLARSFALQS